MFQNMGYTGGIIGCGAETDIEYLVLVIIGYKCHPCSGLLVTAQIGHAVNVRDLPFLYNLICG